MRELRFPFLFHPPFVALYKQKLNSNRHVEFRRALHAGKSNCNSRPDEYSFSKKTKLN